MLKSAQPNRKQHAHHLFQRERQVVKHVKHTPCANVEDRKDEYVITVAAPGFHRQHLQVNIDGNEVCINAKKEACTTSCEPGKKVRSEYDFSEWKRHFRLPQNADTFFTNAFYLNGELEVHIPKSDKPLTSASVRVDVY